jgi:FkbM family methyltransferase
MKRLISQLPPDAHLAIDVGANLGLFTLNLIAAEFQPLHAFEPDPMTFEHFYANSRRNGITGVTLNCMAVGEHVGVATFHRGGGSATHHIASHSDSSAGSINVATMSLDRYIEDHKIESIGLLKIDVEGYEPWVLRGARKSLLSGKIHAILIEICPANLNQAGVTVEILTQELQHAGFTLYRLCANGSLGKPLTISDLNAVAATVTGYDNAIGLPAGSPLLSLTAS